MTPQRLQWNVTCVSLFSSYLLQDVAVDNSCLIRFIKCSCTTCISHATHTSFLQQKECQTQSTILLSNINYFFYLKLVSIPKQQLQFKNSMKIQLFSQYPRGPLIDVELFLTSYCSLILQINIH